MSFRIAHFNILGKNMAGTMWFHYARDFLPPWFSNKHWDWSRAAGFPRSLMWSPEQGRSRFYRLQVLIKEIRALRADILCLVELDCFTEFQDILGREGYDAVFQPRPGKQDGCGIFWRREVFGAVGPCRGLIYARPANDRIAVGQVLTHLPSQRQLLVLSTHLHWDQAAGHQASEAEELLGLLEDMAADYQRPAAVVCGDLNALPDSEAYQILSRCLCDASFGPDGAYAEGAFTTLKPDVYYFARPKGQGDGDHWHWQEGRHEVLDYVFYRDLELLKPVMVPHMSKELELAERPAKRQRSAGDGYWSGGWRFRSSPAPGLAEHAEDDTWRPPRVRGQLQLGIPNRSSERRL
ncbi:unnamed protein product [Effrenium voratum]|nr:unnamed protein product [Effrenium voratum]